uniref:Condensin-2 complex subunit H2 n=1 Tax=Plectus sambesii TaxID=2011161 RepID=A0A914XMQ7_9BILA
MEDDDDTLAANQYAYLLQPIKDLAKNWDIDIVGLLDKYIERELHPSQDTTESKDGRFNFAEAAMLIQGTTCVYGRKVEYLYQKVLQTKELLANRKKQKDDQQQAGEDNEGGGGHNDDDDDDPESNEDSDVLVSFDKLKPGKGVEMRERRNVLAADLLQPLLPMALIPLADFEKANVPLVSRTGEVLGKKDDFRVNNCYVHSDGPLLLDLVNENFIQEFVDPRYVTLLEEPDRVVHMAADPVSYDCDDDGGGGADFDYEGPTQTEVERDGGVTALGDQLDHLQRASITLLKVGEHLRRSDRRATALTDATDKASQMEEEESHDDPFAEHDPYDMVPGDKKIKVGKPYRFPEQIAKVQQRKRMANGELKEEAAMIESVIDFIDRCFYSRAAKVGPHKWPIECPALEDYFYKEYKRRMVVRRTWDDGPVRKRGERIAMYNAPVPPTGDSDDEGDYGGGAFDDDEIGGGGDEGVPQQMGKSDGCDDDGPLLDDDDLIGPELPEDALKVPADEHLERPNSQMNYEDQLKFHLDKYWASATEHLTTSALARRVQQWEKRVAPMLESENHRRPFDIHEYGSEILERFGGLKEKHSFDELMGKETRYEKCRYFLSTLMMANTLNVELGDDHKRLGVDGAVNTMHLTLLNRNRHHRQFESE